MDFVTSVTSVLKKIIQNEPKVQEISKTDTNSASSDQQIGPEKLPGKPRRSILKEFDPFAPLSPAPKATCGDSKPGFAITKLIDNGDFLNEIIQEEDAKLQHEELNISELVSQTEKLAINDDFIEGITPRECQVPDLNTTYDTPCSPLKIADGGEEVLSSLASSFNKTIDVEESAICEDLALQSDTSGEQSSTDTLNHTVDVLDASDEDSKGEQLKECVRDSVTPTSQLEDIHQETKNIDETVCTQIQNSAVNTLSVSGSSKSLGATIEQKVSFESKSSESQLNNAESYVELLQESKNHNVNRQDAIDVGFKEPHMAPVTPIPQLEDIPPESKNTVTQPKNEECYTQQSAVNTFEKVSVSPKALTSIVEQEVSVGTNRSVSQLNEAEKCALTQESAFKKPNTSSKILTPTVEQKVSVESIKSESQSKKAENHTETVQESRTQAVNIPNATDVGSKEHSKGSHKASIAPTSQLEPKNTVETVYQPKDDECCIQTQKNSMSTKTLTPTVKQEASVESNRNESQSNKPESPVQESQTQAANIVDSKEYSKESHKVSVTPTYLLESKNTVETVSQPKDEECCIQTQESAVNTASLTSKTLTPTLNQKVSVESNRSESQSNKAEVIQESHTQAVNISNATDVDSKDHLNEFHKASLAPISQSEPKNTVDTVSQPKDEECCIQTQDSAVNTASLSSKTLTPTLKQEVSVESNRSESQSNKAEVVQESHTQAVNISNATDVDSKDHSNESHKAPLAPISQPEPENTVDTVSQPKDEECCTQTQESAVNTASLSSKTLTPTLKQKMGLESNRNESQSNKAEAAQETKTQAVNISNATNVDFKDTPQEPHRASATYISQPGDIPKESENTVETVSQPKVEECCIQTQENIVNTTFISSKKLTPTVKQKVIVGTYGNESKSDEVESNTEALQKNRNQTVNMGYDKALVPPTSQVEEINQEPKNAEESALNTIFKKPSVRSELLTSIVEQNVALESKRNECQSNEVESHVDALEKNQNHAVDTPNATNVDSTGHPKVARMKIEPKRDEELLKKISNLENELSEARRDKLYTRSKADIVKQFEVVLVEYEKQIKTQNMELENLKQENETITRHFSNLELAFSDVFQKYEKTKLVVGEYKANEEILKKSLLGVQAEVKKSEAKLETFKTDSQEAITRANQQVKMEKQHSEQEISKLRAIVKRLEIKCSSLETSLNQKNQECQDLATLCDDLTNK